MTDQHLQMIEKTGMSREKFIGTLNLVYMLSDIQEIYLMTLEDVMKKAGFYGFEDKQLIKDALLRTRKVVKLVDRVTSYDYAEEFGDRCDELKVVIDKWADE